MRLVHPKRRVWVGMGLLLLLALFLVRPGGARLKARIAGSISAALGRQVDIDAVHIRILPQPGFDLKNFVVHDDPSFSAERGDRKSTRLNSSHRCISYAVFCLKKKKTIDRHMSLQ